MKVIITCETMAYLSGSPLYNYELAMELKRVGHEVYLVSAWEPVVGDGATLRKNLMRAGVKCLWPYELDQIKSVHYIIASQRTSEKVINHFNVPTLYVVHSEYPCEFPPLNDNKNIIGYVGIRDSIVKKLKLTSVKPVYLVYNGIDLKRFDPRLRYMFIKNNTQFAIDLKGLAFFSKTVLLPCTIDKLREKFINSMVSKFKHVVVCGDKFDGNVVPADNLEICKSRFDIENVICKSHLVAGIKLGRVNLEAYAMGVDSLIVDPETLAMQVLESPFSPLYTQYDKKALINIFNEKHDINNVAFNFFNIFNNTVDKDALSIKSFLDINL
jgi:glycosyltransferase involved in cell wall biosynthesis